ncbi:MAG: ABC transporter ATP-binding protein [Cyclobacteriaceae bacterium]|nr:MAG: ABC transporter ATP-binding protein [Cyclobacteriaceae bacterium]
MVAINNLSYFIGDRALFDNASLHIKNRDKIGLVGLNGTGKSTLLRLINGSYQPGAGAISKSKECTIGYLDQDLLSYNSKESILHVAMQAYKEACSLQEQIEQTLKELDSNYQDETVLKLTRLQEEFDRLDGYTMQARAEEVLEGIGFSTSDLGEPLNQFSGGWRMRVILARLLLEKPDLLLLDEPTNHLDLPSIKWVEQYLRAYEGAVVVVSHDREFLDQVATTIVEVDQMKLIPYSGNYSFYLEEKALRDEIQNNAFLNQQQKIKQTEQFISRFRAKASKARQVQSRIKSLERMDRIGEVSDTMSPVNFRFTFQQKSGRTVCELKRISKAYSDSVIFKDTSAIIERGKKIALIGANGKGKSTLLRIIAGTEKITGESILGYNVNMAFYAQHQLEALHLDNEILEELKQCGSGKTELELRSILGCFLFSDDEVFKRIKVLSGGEKSRVALAKTLISESNFLLLDEPTNHLDMQSVQILIQALNQFKGTFVIVSHDRHFISKVADTIWYIEDQQIKIYPGTYGEYEYWQSNRTSKTVEIPASPKSKKGKSTVKKKKLEKNQLQELQSQLKNNEDRITKLESEKLQLEQKLSDPLIYSNPDLLKQASDAFKKNQGELEIVNKEWEEIATQIDKLE